MSWSVSSLAKHSPVLQVSCITSLTVIAAAFWWLHREQLLNLCLLYQAKRLACWRVMGLLKVVYLAFYDGGHNPLGSYNCFLFVIFGTTFYFFMKSLHALPFLFIYIALLIFYHRHILFFLTVFFIYLNVISSTNYIDLSEKK